VNTQNTPTETSLPEKNEAKKLSNWLGEISKFTVAVVFILYIFGYVIWHASFAQYGISPPGLWKIEFFSAALCYFAIVLSISVPAALLWLQLPGQPQPAFFVSDKLPITPLLLLSIFSLMQVRSFFFPGVSSETAFWTWAIVMSILAALVGLHVFLTRADPLSGRMWSFFRKPWLPLLMLLMCLVSLLQSKRADSSFVVSTLFLYVFATSIFGIRVDEKWSSFPAPLKMLAVICAAFVVLGNAREFGTRQFGKIPARVGGGEALKALLSFNTSHQHLPILLGIPIFNPNALGSQQLPVPLNTVAPPSNVTTNLVPTNALSTSNIAGGYRTSPVVATNSSASSATLTNRGPFWGPVFILMRSEREVVFDVDLPTTNRSHRAKIIRADQIDAIEFLPEP